MASSTDGVPPLGILRVVSFEDSALDWVAMDGARYMRTRDESLVRVLPGQTATWYTLRPLPRELLFDWVDLIAAPEGRWRRALAACLVQIENPISAETGQVTPTVWTPESLPLDGLGEGIRVGKLVDIQRMIQPAGAVYELGKLAYDRAYLSPKAPSVCAPPPGQQDRIQERLRHAARRPPDSLPSSSPEMPTPA